MSVENLTIAELKQIGSMLNPATPQKLQPFEVGKAYLIRTVTHINIGIVTEVGDQEIVMQDASWIADTGRYADALKSGTLNEVEPYPDGEKVIVGRGALVDATRWLHALPRIQK